MNKAPNLTPACRDDCGACCTAPSISSPIPGMPMGKPAGVRCAQLGDDQRCRIFGRPERPPVCASLQPSDEMCGQSRTDALLFLSTLDRLTAPSPPTPLPHAGEGSEVSRYATFKL